MAERIVFRRDLCHCARRTDVILGTQCQSQGCALDSGNLQCHQPDRLLVFYREHHIGNNADDLSDQTKGNFYLFFVILSSSLEAPAFHMTSIRYLNSVVQVVSSYIRPVFNHMLTSTSVPLGVHCHCLLPVRDGQ